MSLFKSLFSKSISKEEVQSKAMEGITYYQNRHFKKAVKSLEEYFEMKGSGKFPDLDGDDAGMLLNLANAKQYSNDLTGAISIYEILSEKIPTWDAPYLMKSVCLYKLGDTEKSKIQWELARRFGNEMAQNSFESTIIKF